MAKITIDSNFVGYYCRVRDFNRATIPAVHAGNSRTGEIFRPAGRKLAKS